MFSVLRRWFTRTRPARPDLHVVMITRSGCHLCDDAWDRLLDYQKQHGFNLEKLDVDTAPELVAEYGNCVPVVLINGVVRFRARLNEVLLQRLLDAKSL